MRAALTRLLDSHRAPMIGGACSLLLGLFFTFVWAPHPWGWQGIDAYHELARVLAAGGTFPTTDVPWGYAYYAAFFYKLSGERMWTPLLAQVIANAFVPLLLYRLVRPVDGIRTAALSALIVGLFSFNTIYASTQSSDTICTVLFLGGLLAFSSGVRRPRLAAFALAGVFFGLAPQFRPNLVLLPAFMIATYLLLRPRHAGKIAPAAVFAIVVTLMQVPWILHNYRLTGMLLPTSTHGGVQLWYGTLQVGPYLESRAHNPRFHFESAPFDYTSLIQRPIHVTAGYHPCSDPPNPTTLVYWTDRDRERRAIAPNAGWLDTGQLAYDIPPQPNDTTLYYFLEQAAAAGNASHHAPWRGADDPLVLFISDNHLGDLDTHDDVLDAFDIIRVLRHLAWGEPLRTADRIDLSADGRIDVADLEQIVRMQTANLLRDSTTAAITRIETADQSVTLHLVDGSWLSVPRDFSGLQTDLSLSLNGEMAPALISRRRTMTSIRSAPPPRGSCIPATTIRANSPFNWSEPHMMQRYMALAFDNIRREPLAFAAASAYRFVRLFVVRGTSDVSTAQQFRGSNLVYFAGTALSIGYLVVFAAGVWIAYQRRSALLLFLIPIVYVPLTICFVLTNMRYTVTVQPLMFVFVAVAIAAALKLEEGTTSGSGRRSNA
jgi:hypothetical protein